MIFTPFRMTVAWRSQRMSSTCCHSPACRSPLLHLADVCAPCAAAKRPMTNLKRPMSKRHGPHDQNKTPHDETTWIARVKLNAIFPVSVGTAKNQPKSHQNFHSARVYPCVFHSQFEMSKREPAAIPGGELGDYGHCIIPPHGAQFRLLLRFNHHQLMRI